MKKITNSQWEKIERNPFNSFYKIGYYDAEQNRFDEVATWQNHYGTAGANYGLLQIWTPLHNVSFFEKQGGYNTAGGYNKPIANLEGCLYQYKKAVDGKEIVTDHAEGIKYSNCGSIASLMEELKDYLQYHFNVKLFVLPII